MDLESLKKIWNNENPYIEVQTSGSTSKPKRILVEKKRMIASAKLTCDKLKLKNCTALLCMNLKYIGAKMMVVRSEIANMRLITVPPSGHPLAMCTEPIDFAAMVPLQVYNSLQIPTEFKRLQQIKKLIIGGGPINETLLKSIANFPHEVYSTYGMTET